MAHIKTIKEVESFFKQLLRERLNFHPDNDFADYVNYDTHQPTYTAEEAEALNKKMEQCFEVCEHAGVDIYGIACDLFNNQ